MSLIDFTYMVLTFAIVIGVTGLRGRNAWPRGQGGYVTVTIDGKQIHRTTTVHNKGDPEWNDTFQL